ncbi:hypothetical protein [Pseudomonas sp. W2Aug9]|uniref:hypothetical protein n=1 Tax=Pseudomonas sp. W2Aug9 TaxID=1215242 RepID=UPI0020068583|nr:hypothetical protein [Pseudomonas sp. W2Aug9]
MTSAVTGLHARRDLPPSHSVLLPEANALSPANEPSTIPHVKGIAPISVTPAGLKNGRQISEKHLQLLHQFRALNQQIHALTGQQPTLSSVIEQQLAEALYKQTPLDATKLYFHRYHTDEQGQRTLLSVEPATAALFNALKTSKGLGGSDASTSPATTDCGFYLGDAPAERDKQLDAAGSLLSIAQTIEKELPSSLARFWTEPRSGEANPEARQGELLRIQRQMLSTLAALQVEEGTMLPAAKVLIDKAIEYPTLEARESAMQDGERPGVYPLKLDTPKPNGTLMAGAFLITSSDGSSTQRPFNNSDTNRALSPSEQRGLTVLYTPRDGYEVFDSPAKALQAWRQRLSNNAYAAQQAKQRLPISVEQSLKPGWENELSQTLIPLTTDVIAAGVPQLLERQQQQVNTELQALFDDDRGVANTDPWQRSQTLRDLDQASALAPHFSADNVLRARNEWLLERLSEQDNLQVMQQRTANRSNWQYLAQQLNQAGQALPENATAQDISALLKSTPMRIAPDSAHYQSSVREPGKSISLEAFINENDLPLPKTLDELLSLAQTAIARAQQHPLGNFGGGLSWPIPMTAREQQTVRAVASDYKVSTQMGLLDYLNTRQPLSQDVLQDPVKTLEALVGSPQGHALGLEMQTNLGGVSTDISVNDYTLALMNLALDPESLTRAHRNWVAGFDLTDKKYWGQPLSAIIEGLSRHLIETGRASSAMAKAGAYLLLMRAAPQLLVKDVPDSVVYGSVAWATLCIAVAAIEAQSPGSVAHMTYAEVMIAADARDAAPKPAQTAILLNWAVANNILNGKQDALYTQDDINKAQAAFNHQQTELEKASALLDTPLPSRREIALALLKKTFGENVAFEEPKFAKTSPYASYAPGISYSMLDIVMEGNAMDERWKIIKGGDGIDLARFTAFTKSPEFSIQKDFDEAFSTVTANHKAVKKLSIMNALTNLPPEDKKNLSFGEIQYYQEKSYKIGTLGNTLFHTSSKVIVTAKRNGTTSNYEFDTEKGLIKNLGNIEVPRDPEYIQNEVTKTEEFFPDQDLSKWVDGSNTLAAILPFGVRHADDIKRHILDQPRASAPSAPYLFTDERANHIADSIVKALDFDNPAIRKAAMGATRSEQGAEQEKVIGNFLLDFIPFRSAIVNFIDGNYSEGITDVAFDIFGFITAGVGAAAKAAKVLAKGGSALKKVLKVTKIMGTSLLSELNPLAGVGDLIVGGAKVVTQGAGHVINNFRFVKSTLGRPELINLSKRYDAVANGTFKVGEQTLHGSAVFQNGKWGLYDPISGRPYGTAKGFKPEQGAIKGEIKGFSDYLSWERITNTLAPPVPPNKNFRTDYNNVIADAKSKDLATYSKGWRELNPEAVYGYSPAMTIDQLKRLAVAQRRTPGQLGSLAKRIADLQELPDRFKMAHLKAALTDKDGYARGYRAGQPAGLDKLTEKLTLDQVAELAIAPERTPEQIGYLVRHMEKIREQASKRNFKRFSEDIGLTDARPPIVIKGIPQGLYLSRVDLLSEGECAALSTLMAEALKQGKHEIFLENLSQAMRPVPPGEDIAELRKLDPAKADAEQLRATQVATFRSKLSRLQEKIETKYLQPGELKQVPSTGIISDLASSRETKTLLISTPDHGLMARVVVDLNGNKTWFYFDPNYGLAIFTDETQMKAALEMTLRKGQSKAMLSHFDGESGLPEYQVSVLKESQVNPNVAAVPGGVSDLFTPL